MTWKECDPMQQKVQFILFLQQGNHSMTELCQLFGISRKTGYKWLRRYRKDGPVGLNEYSRAPLNIPHKTDPKVVEFVRKTMKKHPYWGGRKVRDYAFKKAPDLDLPSETTVSNIIEREGLKKRKTKRRRPGHPGKPIFFTEDIHDLWTTDFKGEFKMKNGQYCYPLTIMDEHTRFVLECRGLNSTSQDPVINVFKEAFEKYGMPKAIKSDNGTPFASVGIARISKLSAWWIKLGIQPILIQPASPGQNAYHERMHKTLKEETTFPPAGDLGAQNRKFRVWMNEYNFDRPHESLGGDFPGDYYTPSPRKFISTPSKIQYPDHFEVRRVSANHCIRWNSNSVNIGSVLATEHLGFEPIADGIWAVWFSWKRIGFLDERIMKIVDTYGKTGRKKKL